MSEDWSESDSEVSDDEPHKHLSAKAILDHFHHTHHGSHAVFFGMGQSGMDALGSWRSLAAAATIGRFKSSRKNIGVEDGEDDAESDDDDSNSSEHDEDDRTGGGLYAWSPRLYDWISARWTTTGRFLVLVCFMVLDSARFLQLEFALNEHTHVNILSIYFMACLLSFTVAFTGSIMLDGRWAVAKIFSWQGLGRFFIAAILFISGTFLTVQAYKTGLSPTFVIMLSKLYLPVCAVGSILAFNRRYSSLEWLSLAMLILGVTAFVLLRYQCHVNYCHEITKARVKLSGIAFMLASVLCAAPASLMAEKVFKEHKGVGYKLRDRRNKYYICRAQLDFWMTLMTFCCWAADEWILPGIAEGSPDSSADIPQANHLWFGSWTKRQYILVFILAAQSWLAGLMVQRFSTVSKGVAQSLATVGVVMLGDPLFNKYGMRTRFYPSLFITIIAVLSALIFQTGRLNVKEMQQMIAAHSDHVHGSLSSMTGNQLLHKARESVRVGSSGIMTGLSAIGQYSVIILYILADSFRSNLMYVVQANRFFVPQTMAVASAVCGVGFASVMTLRSYGWSGFKSAWNPAKIKKFMVCGALQALTTSLSSMAYALGTSPSLVVALGKVYTPLVAIFSRWILGKKFMWLEWFALIILTAASFAFGMMQDLGGTDDGSGGTKIAGAVCVIASAASSCLMSLLMEKFLKGETDPFILQKVRLDFGSVLFSVAFLPVMGFLGTLPGNRRTDVAWWVPRSGPDYWACQAVAMRTSFTSSNGCDGPGAEFMVNWTKVGNSTALREAAAGCVCGSGVGLGWGTNYMIYVGLAAVVFHSWITGVLVSQFSSVYRAVADGVPVVLIYFILDPLFSRVPLQPFRVAYSSGALAFPPMDWARDCVCLILPLSGTTFSVASSEMQKVADLHSNEEEKGERELLDRDGSDSASSDDEAVE